ncbi:MAG TPA: DinB family protein [Terriglobales bacterium]|nr:DinB family protein [Terriglobales bacterium]
MTMLEHIRNLFSYDEWANREVLRALQTLDVPPARSISLLAHILSAERLWLERLLAEKQTLPVWPNSTLGQCKLEVDQLAGLWNHYLTSLSEQGLSRSVAYRNTKGESFNSQTQDILLHVIMHSAYHRGQIAADMRDAGFTPAYTDFIHAVRQGFLDQSSHSDF